MASSAESAVLSPNRGTSDNDLNAVTSSSSNTGVTLTSFEKYFNKLPTELRLKVWEYYIESDAPGIVEIEIKFKEDSTEYRRCMKNASTDSTYNNGNITRPSNLFGCIRAAHRQFDIRPLQSIPKVLHLCRESRAEALRYYKLSFGTGAWHEARTYVKFDRETSTVLDTICVRFSMSKKSYAALRTLTHGAVCCLERYDIKRLGIFAEPPFIDPVCLESHTDLCRSLLPNLNSIYVIMDDCHKGRRGDGVAFVDSGDCLLYIRLIKSDLWFHKPVPDRVAGCLTGKKMIREANVDTDEEVARYKALTKLTKKAWMVLRGFVSRKST